MALKELGEGWILDVKDKNLFDPDTMRRLDLTEGLGVLVGKKPGSTTLEVQAVRFAKKEFNKAAVDEWITSYMAGPRELLLKLASGELAPAQVLGISADEQKMMAVLGHQAYEDGNLDRAKSIFEALIRINPLTNLGHTGLGRVLQAQKQLDAAMNAYKEAVKHNASDCDALLGQAEILMGRQQKKPALPLLLQVLYLDREGIEVAARTAGRIVAEKITNDDLKDFMNWGETRLQGMAKEQLKAQGKAVKTLSGAPTPAAIAAGAARPVAAVPPRPMRG